MDRFDEWVDLRYQRLLPGDLVARRKGPVRHKGVVLSGGRILHNTPGRGEHVSSLEEFAAGRRVEVLRNLSGASRARAYRASPRSGARYHLLANNCEHTVSRAIHGRERSPQLHGWIAGIGIAAFAFAVTRHPAITVAGFVLGQRLAERFANRS